MGFAEQNARLRALLARADEMSMTSDPGLYRLTVTQVVNGYEALAKKKRAEAAHLREQIAFCEAQAATCEQMVQILGDIVEQAIRKEQEAREEAARQAQERQGASGAAQADLPGVPTPDPRARGRTRKPKG